MVKHVLPVLIASFAFSFYEGAVAGIDVEVESGAETSF